LPAFIERPVISVAIAANGAMYAGTYDGLYRSIDASVNWSKIEINGQITSIVHSTAPHPTDANTLMVGTNDTVQLDTVWKTIDGSSSWTSPDYSRCEEQMACSRV
jgi:hypothetical protein